MSPAAPRGPSPLGDHRSCRGGDFLGGYTRYKEGEVLRPLHNGTQEAQPISAHDGRRG
jgi:hypothetical protein